MILKDLIESNKILLQVIVFLLINTLVMFAGKQFLITEDVYYNSLGDQLSYEKIAEIINAQEKWDWLMYVIVPIYFLFKFFVVAICLSIGALAFGYKISTRKLFQIALIAEFVFFIPAIVRIAWFGGFESNYDLTDINSFSVFSLYQLIGSSDIQSWFIYPLQLINVFEVMYCLLLAKGLHYLIKGEKFTKMIGLVGSSYGVALCLWAIFVMFLTVNFSI